MKKSRFGSAVGLRPDSTRPFRKLVHLRVVDPLCRLAERPAVVTLEPRLELPRLAVDEAAAIKLGGAPVALPRRVELPVGLGRYVVLACLEVAEDAGNHRPEVLVVGGRRQLERHHLCERDELALDRAADHDLVAEQAVAFDHAHDARETRPRP